MFVYYVFTNMLFSPWLGMLKYARIKRIKRIREILATLLVQASKMALLLML